MENSFTVENVILDDLSYDKDIKKWLGAIYYGEIDNNLMLQMPKMKLIKLTIEPGDNRSLLKVYLKLEAPNHDFIYIVEQIEGKILLELKKHPNLGKYSIENLFKPCSEDGIIYKFLVPIYENNLDVVIIDSKHEKKSIKNLEKGALVSGVLYLSHLEIESNSLYLNWNIIQLRLE